MSKQPSDKKQGLLLSVTIPSVIFVLLFCIAAIVWTEEFGNIINNAMAFVTDSIGSIYLYFSFACLLIALWLAFGRFGNKRLGGGKPEMSTFAWVATLFGAASSNALMYWGTIEFIYYLDAPPFGAEPFSLEAFRWSSAYGAYHWGPIAFASYAVMGVLFGYYMYVQRKKTVRPSGACTNIIGEKHANGLFGKIIDVLYVVALICGIGTTFGIAIPLLSGLVSHLFGLQSSIMIDAAIVIALTIAFSITVFTGLKKGMTLINNIRTYGAIFVLLSVLIVGPTVFILNYTSESIGVLFQNFIQMSFQTDPHGGSGFPQAWTIFYWAWFLAFTLYYAIFLARISKGRTIRQFVIGIMGAGCLGSALFFWILGGAATDIFNKGTVDVYSLVMDDGYPVQAIIAIWEELPLSVILIPFFFVYCFVGVWTCIQGNAYTLALSTEKTTDPDAEPSRFSRVLWAVFLGMFSLALIYLGGLNVIKAVSVVGSLPVAFICILVALSVSKDIRKYGWPDFSVPSKTKDNNEPNEEPAGQNIEPDQAS